MTKATANPMSWGTSFLELPEMKSLIEMPLATANAIDIGLYASLQLFEHHSRHNFAAAGRARHGSAAACIITSRIGRSNRA